jgi:uncharacterized integral membrane protein
MITLVVTALLALAFALFATQNTELISLKMGPYLLPNIPVYIVVLLPLLLGLFLSLIIHVIKDLSTSLTESEQKDEIKRLTNENAELTKEVHKLELENTKLKAKNGQSDFDEESI